MSEIHLEYPSWRNEGKKNEKGQFHCLDGPAINSKDGHKEWWKDGILHNLNGPAIISPTGYLAWYIDGIEYTEEEFLKATSEGESFSR